MTDIRKTVERIVAKQRRFWVGILMAVIAISLVAMLLMAIILPYITTRNERKAQAELNRSLEAFMTKPLVVVIPLRYELSVGMGIETVTFKKATITCYNNEVRQTDSTPNHTATGRMVAEGMIAASQDIFRNKLQPGDLVYVVKLKQYFILEDTMNARHRNHFDKFFYIQNADQMHPTFTSDVVGIRLR